MLGKRPAPEFADWLARMGIADEAGNLIGDGELPALMQPVLGLLE
jgi:ethanolamine ammonia-lyase large subunit